MNDVWCVFFFFQAEDGIRDTSVTGVQTCALPISDFVSTRVTRRGRAHRERAVIRRPTSKSPTRQRHAEVAGRRGSAERRDRSEERRVGKECRARWGRGSEEKRITSRGGPSVTAVE